MTHPVKSTESVFSSYQNDYRKMFIASSTMQFLAGNTRFVGSSLNGQKGEHVT